MSQGSVHLHIRQKAFPGRAGEPPRVVLENVEIAVEPGEFIALSGASGCGKTTLLNIVSGIDPHFEGRFDLAEQRLAYVFQEPTLLPWRTIEQNLRLVLPPEERSSDRPLRYLKRMGLLDYRQAYPGDLSLGMARRVSLARAFSIQPDLLLLDEPFVSLDEENAQLLRRLLLELWQERRCAVLFVTHDLNEALELADRVIFLSPEVKGIAQEVRLTQPREHRTAEFLAELRRELSLSAPDKEEA